MPHIALSLLPFPPASWWAAALAAPHTFADLQEPFRKMGRQSRYRIATAAGPHWLSIPLQGGREQRGRIENIKIDNKVPWQRTHWRTLQSAYRRAPFFEHYAPSLQPFYEQLWESVAAFSQASIEWMSREIGLRVSLLSERSSDMKIISLHDRRDEEVDTERYIQVFEDRTGFLPQLSALDLLLCKGPAARAYLERAAIKKASAMRWL